MRRLMVVVLGVFVALSVATPASATTNVDAITSALQKAPVYIDQATEGTTPDTAGTLTTMLNGNDNVVLVMLPADTSLTQEDVNALAQKISSGLKSQRIVGISVGAQFAGAASIMPSGVASDLMHRAAVVSTDSVETLGTFVRNVHDWQTSNPSYVPVLKPAKASGPGFPWWIVIGGILLVMILLVILIINRRRIRSQVHYTAPGGLNDPVEKMMKLRERLSNHDDMYDAIDLLCRYTEAYFKRFTPEKKSPATITAFSNQLELAQKVVEAYADVRKDPQYYDDPQKVMSRGVDSIQGLADTVLASIKKGNADRLMDYNVSTNILDAQRYKDPNSHR
jgi:hypothetical protein